MEGQHSFTDLRARLFRKKAGFDRAPVITEERYKEKTLEGNWYERRVVETPSADDWRTVYEVDYRAHVADAGKDSEVARWDNKLDLEGLPRELLIDHHGKAYYENMTTSYDLSYNVLPNRSSRSRVRRTYNARKQRWIPEQDLTSIYGNLTEFGLWDSLKRQTYERSEKGIADCRWRTTYEEDIGRPRIVDVKRDIQRFNKRRVDMNVPDLKHFEDKTSDIRSCLIPA